MRRRSRVRRCRFIDDSASDDDAADEGNSASELDSDDSLQATAEDLAFVNDRPVRQERKTKKKIKVSAREKKLLRDDIALILENVGLRSKDKREKRGKTLVYKDSDEDAEDINTSDEEFVVVDEIRPGEEDSSEDEVSKPPDEKDTDVVVIAETKEPPTPAKVAPPVQIRAVGHQPLPPLKVAPIFLKGYKPPPGVLKKVTARKPATKKATAGKIPIKKPWESDGPLLGYFRKGMELFYRHADGRVVSASGVDEFDSP